MMDARVVQCARSRVHDARGVDHCRATTHGCRQLLGIGQIRKAHVGSACVSTGAQVDDAHRAELAEAEQRVDNVPPDEATAAEDGAAAADLHLCVCVCTPFACTPFVCTPFASARLGSVCLVVVCLLVTRQGQVEAYY